MQLCPCQAFAQPSGLAGSSTSTDTWHREMTIPPQRPNRPDELQSSLLDMDKQGNLKQNDAHCLVPFAFLNLLLTSPNLSAGSHSSFLYCCI